jgi:hypothetical protein
MHSLLCGCLLPLINSSSGHASGTNDARTHGDLGGIASAGGRGGFGYGGGFGLVAIAISPALGKQQRQRKSHQLPM